MKRFKLLTLWLAIMALFIAAPAQAVLQDMQASVYKWEGGMNADGTMKLTLIESGITFKVLAKSSNTAETLYYPAKTTSLTNPVSTTNFASTSVCNKKVAFRVDPTDSTDDRYVDLIVVNTAGGFTAFVEDFDRYTHTIIIDQRPNVVHQGAIWFGGSTTDEIDTGINFLAHTRIHDVMIEVVTAASAATIDIGLLSTETSGDADGFRKGILLTTTGYVKDTAVITNGTTIDFTVTSTYGALLVSAIAGSDAVATGGGKQYLGHTILLPTSYAHSLTYTGYSTTGAGYIYYWFNRNR